MVWLIANRTVGYTVYTQKPTICKYNGTSSTTTNRKRRRAGRMGYLCVLMLGLPHVTVTYLMSKDCEITQTDEASIAPSVNPENLM